MAVEKMRIGRRKFERKRKTYKLYREESMLQKSLKL